jgi:hypothetical protein
VRCITVTHTIGDNMSHPAAARGGWHACCSIPYNCGTRRAEPKTPAGTLKKNSADPTRSGALSDTARSPDNNEKTLLHTSKRPTTPRKRGLFLSAAASDTAPGEKYARSGDASILGELTLPGKWHNAA